MIRIAITFPVGRYHATSWGSHVNEGVVEWPPSPWRLCRVLLAVWHRKLRPDVSAEIVDSILAKLASKLPSYSLPVFEASHTRHYMPVIKGAAESRTKVFDTFYRFSNEEEAIVVHWAVDLTGDETHALERLVSAVQYLGRAESLAEAKLTDFQPQPNAWPLDPEHESELGADEELVEIIAPQPVDAYAEWLASRPRPAGKRKQAKKGEPAKTLRGALEMDTNDWRDHGWSQPPGSRWVTYVRAQPRKAGTPVNRRPRSPEKKSIPTVARFALASNVLPRIKDALILTEQLHDYLLGIARRLNEENPDQFSIQDFQAIRGTDDRKQPLQGHGHSYILPECDDQARIRFLTIYARSGITPPLQRVLERLNKFRDLQFVLIGFGHPEDFGGTDRRAGFSLPLAESDTWRSLTPFIPTRHPKKRGGILDRTAEAQRDLERLLAEALPTGLSPELTSITPTDDPPAWLSRVPDWRQFRTRRLRGNGAHGGNAAYGFRIQFSKPLRGPIAVGYAAHYGLGLFVPESDTH